MQIILISMLLFIFKNVSLNTCRQSAKATDKCSVKIFQLLDYLESIKRNKLVKKLYKYNTYVYIECIFLFVIESDSSMQMLDKNFSLLTLLLILILLISICRSQSVPTSETYITGNTGSSEGTGTTEETTLLITTTNSSRSLLIVNKS
jgi:hypothetical protein